MNLLLIFLGGGLGAVMRHSLSSLVMKQMDTGFPWGTLAVNLLGAFVMGVFIELFALKLSLPASTRLFLTTGLLGGFTTFSAFSLDSALMVQRGDWLPLAAYVGLSVAGTIALVLAGMQLARGLL